MNQPSLHAAVGTSDLADPTWYSRYLSISKSGQKSGGESGWALLWPNLMAHSGPLR